MQCPSNIGRMVSDDGRGINSIKCLIDYSCTLVNCDNAYVIGTTTNMYHHGCTFSGAWGSSIQVDAIEHV